MVALAAVQQTSITVSNDVITDSIIAAVNAVHNSCRVNTDMVNQYTGGPLATTEINGKPVLLTFLSIHGAQTKIMTDSLMTPNLTRENTERAAHTVLNTLEFSVPATVVALMEKKPQLKDAGLVEVVKNSLELLLHNHIAAGTAIGPKTNKENKELAEDLEREVVEVTGKIKEGVEYFSS